MDKNDLKEINFFLELLKKSFQEASEKGNILERNGIKIFNNRLLKIQEKVENEIKQE